MIMCMCSMYMYATHMCHGTCEDERRAPTPFELRTFLVTSVFSCLCLPVGVLVLQMCTILSGLMWVLGIQIHLGLSGKHFTH